MVSENEPEMMPESTEEQAPTVAESFATETEAQEVVQAPKTKTKKTSGRRAALRILREEVGSLGKEIVTFRRSLDASSKKLEKQVAALQSEVAALKSHIAKEGVRARTKQESLLTKILARVNTPKPKPKAAKKAKKSKGKK